MNEYASTCIYVLVDPRDGTSFYVGKTGFPENRLRQHMWTPGVYNKERIAELRALCLYPEMHIVAQTERDDEVGPLEGHYTRVFADGHHPGDASIRTVLLKKALQPTLTLLPATVAWLAANRREGETLGEVVDRLVAAQEAP